MKQVTVGELSRICDGLNVIRFDYLTKNKSDGGIFDTARYDLSFSKMTVIASDGIIAFGSIEKPDMMRVSCIKKVTFWTDKTTKLKMFCLYCLSTPNPHQADEYVFVIS